jgi:hypothetical protein
MGTSGDGWGNGKEEIENRKWKIENREEKKD